MATNFSQSLPKIILLVLSTIAIGNATIFGAATQADAKKFNKPQPRNATVTQATAKDVKSGPIFSNDDAKVKCPITTAAVGRQWNGQWVTTIPGKESVCGLKKL